MDRIVLGELNSPLAEFEPQDIRTISYTNTLDVVGAELTIDEFTPVTDYPYTEDSVEIIGGLDFDFIESSDGYIMCTNKEFYNLRLIPHGTVIRYYRDEELRWKGYIKNVNRVGITTFKLNAMSAIGLLDEQYHKGNVYIGSTFENVLAEIIEDSVDYTLDDAVKNISVYGWLPFDTKRKNLHQLLFACGVSVRRNNNGDMHFTFLSNAESTTIPDNRIYIGGDVDYSSPASQVRVTEHGYMALETDDTVVVYDNTDGSETANHTLIKFTQAPLHSLSTTGTLTIDNDGTEYGVNWAVVTGTGVLSGKRYTHSTRILTRFPENAVDQNENIYSVDGCTLVSVVNSENVADRMLAYYARKKTVSSSIVLDNERVGDLISANDTFYETFSGFLSRIEANVSTIIKGNCTIITDFIPPQGGNNYTDSILYTGSGSIDFEALLAQYPNKQNDLVQATLIQGGHGGYKGENGESGQSSSQYAQPGTPGAGGAGGLRGEGGKVLTISFHVSELVNKTLQFSCGAGGTSDSEGTPTTLGDWTSANGTVTPYGVANIFSGEIYAQRGDLDGIAGGGGNPGGSAITFGGQTWYPGATGASGSYWYNREEVYGNGGQGGGAAVGSNGTDGTSYDGEYGHPIIYGTGGKGADAIAGTNATQYGKGGNGGHGAGGGGIGGYYHESSGWIGYAACGAGGIGGDGGKGGDGLLMIYV